MSNIRQYTVQVQGDDLSLCAAAGVDPAELVSSAVREALSELREQERKRRVRAAERERAKAAREAVAADESTPAPTGEAPDGG